MKNGGLHVFQSRGLHLRCTDNPPIIGVFADNQYRPINTLVSADCRLDIDKYKFLFLLPK